MIKRYIVIFLLLTWSITSYADVETDARTCAMAYYANLQKYAQDPSNLNLEDNIKRLIFDGKGSIYNDIYTNVLNQKETQSDIGNYLAEIGGYKNRNGYCLNIEVVASSLSFQPHDATSGYVTATKRVYCKYGRQKIDYSVRERILVRSGRIVNIIKASDNANYLSVSPASVSIDAGGGRRTLSVSTDGAWSSSVTSGSQWISVSTNGNQLTLTIDKNEFTSSRYGNVKIASGLKEQNISITQSAATVVSPSQSTKSAEIKSVTVSENADVNGKKGLSVKVSFSIKGMKGKKGRVVCYFYDENGKALKDLNENYCTTDGDVSVGRTFTPSYDNSTYTDLELLIPYDELHLSGTDNRTLRVNVSVWDYSESPHKELGKKNNTYFTCTPLFEYAKKGYMEITGMTFANVTYDDEILNDYGSTLYKEDMRYLKPKIFYNGLSSESKSLELFFKIYRPDGKLDTGSSSPEGYTRKEQVTIYPGSSKSFVTLGWGNKDGGTYLAGTYRFEIWYNGNKIYSTSFVIKERTNALEKGDWRTIMKKVFTNVTYTYNNGVYKGESSDGKRNGYGAYFWNDDDTFCWATWYNGEKDGTALYIVPENFYFSNCKDCAYYVGDYKNGKVTGKGTCYDKAGNLIYYGNLSDGTPTETYPTTTGYSRYKFECIDHKNGDYYIGETKDGKRHGMGIYLWSNGDAWYGSWEEGERNGSGIYLRFSGSVFTGRWNKDEYSAN